MDIDPPCMGSRRSLTKKLSPSVTILSVITIGIPG
jgi:hypothetical protein